MLWIRNISCLHIVVASIKSVRAVHSYAVLARGRHRQSCILWGHEVVVAWCEVCHSKHLLCLTGPVSAPSHSRGNVPPRLRVLMIVLKIAFLGTRYGPLLIPSLRQLLFTVLKLDLFLLDLALGLVVDLGKVLTDCIVGTQIGVRKVSRHLIARHSLMVHMHELLLNCQVMVSNGQNRNTIFEFLRGLRALLDWIDVLFLAARLPAMW